MNMDTIFEDFEVSKATSLGEKTGNDILTDWTPVQATIGLNESQTYVFSINYTAPGISTSYEIITFISASLCALPDAWNDNRSYNGLSLYYTFNNETDLEDRTKQAFANGYVQDFTKTSANNGSEMLYITIKTDSCPHCPENSTWKYEVGVSQRDLVFQYDSSTFISLVDTDYDSAIFSFDTRISDNNTYDLYLYEGDSYSLSVGLNQSWCAIRQSTDFDMMYSMSNSSTNSIYAIDGLTANTAYIGVVIETYTSGSYGGIIYEQFDFQTTGSRACKLIYDLDFCSEVAYAVPASLNLTAHQQTTGELAEAYDLNARALYEGFLLSMQQIACDASLDSRYSPVSTCTTCSAAYKNWLCAVSIPRCSTSNKSYYKNYAQGEGRSAFIRDVINPAFAYYEILPCIDQCLELARLCPPDFEFTCPSGSLLSKSYCDPTTVNDDDAITVCNYVGKSTSGGSKLGPSWMTLLPVILILFY